MATVFTSNLRLALPTTGAESGTWGDTVNNSITTLVDTAITGLASLSMTTADYTLSTANGATDEARCMFLTIGGTPGAARSIIVPALSKLYIVYNNSTGGYAQTVKTSAGTGISVPNGSRAVLYCDGTNVVTAATYASAMTLGTALPVASGGTGLSSAGTSGYVLASNGTAFVATDLAATTNVWTDSQTFTNSLLKLLGSSTGVTTFTSANAGASDYTVTFQAVTGTVALLGANTWSAAQTFPASGIILTGSSTGVTTFASANAGASNYTLTFPAATATVATLDGTQTLTNKRVTPRTLAAASYTTDTDTSLDCDTLDMFIVTAQAGALLFNNPSGTPTQGQPLLIRIKDNGTARALTYGSQFRAMGTSLPTTTVLSKTLYLGLIWNATDSKWDLVAAKQET